MIWWWMKTLAKANRYGQIPPRNYKMGDSPLHHNHEFSFGLTAKLAATTGWYETILPVSYHDEEIRDSSATVVNPRHASFAETRELAVNHYSITPRVKLSFSAWMTDDAITTLKLKHILFQFMPIYCSFKEDLLAEDDRTGDMIKDILHLTQIDGAEEVHPTFNSKDLLNATTMGASQLGLTTDLKLEGITGMINDGVFHDAMKYYGNGAKLRACVGKLRTVTLNHNGNPFVYSNSNFGDGKVKRGNSYMFCGMFFRCPPVGFSPQSIPYNTTITDSKSQVEFLGRIQYDEWNHNFDQEED